MKTQVLRKLFFTIITSFALLTVVGCDSSDDDPADVFVGNWAVTSITDGDGDQTAAFGAVANSLTVTFEEDGSFNLLLDYNDLANQAGQPDLPAAGTYTVTETNLSLAIPALGATLPFTYNVVSNNQIELTSQSDIVNAAFGTNYTGSVTLTVTRQ